MTSWTCQRTQGRLRSAIAGASPETLVRVEGGHVYLRPIAGTRRRGRTEAEDDALAAEMMADPKESAEHVMLIDLARNTSAASRNGDRLGTPPHVRGALQSASCTSRVMCKARCGATVSPWDVILGDVSGWHALGRTESASDADHPRGARAVLAGSTAEPLVT